MKGYDFCQVYDREIEIIPGVSFGTGVVVRGKAWRNLPIQQELLFNRMSQDAFAAENSMTEHYLFPPCL